MPKNSKLILARGIKLDRNYNNVLSYNENELLSLLRGIDHLIYEMDNYSFIDEFQNIICAQVPYDVCINLNYMAFQNPRYNNKWFFCFIDKIEYNGEKSTNITFHVDSWATWYSYIEKLDCYTIREHVADDGIGKNTIPEDLAVQETVLDKAIITDDSLNNNLYIAVTSNWDIEAQVPFNDVTPYTKSVFGNLIYLFPLADAGLYNLGHFIFITSYDEHINDIHEMFIVPGSMFEGEGITETVNVVRTVALSEVTMGCLKVRYDNLNAYNSITKTYSIAKNYSFNNLPIKNNKCYCYPFNYLLVSNNVGSNNVYKYEDFTTADCDFQLQLALTVGCSGRLVPKNYKSRAGLNFSNIDESLTLAKYPTCSWSGDAYINWLTNSAVNISQQVLGGEKTNIVRKVGDVASLVGSAIGGNALTNSVQGFMGGFSKEQLLPAVTGGVTTGDVNFSNGNQGFTFMKIRAKDEYMKQIDDFFTKFGYKILRIKKPELKSRLYWNYIQIGEGENFAAGNIPQEDLETINYIARKGVTIWHDHNVIGNYNLNNSIR